MAIYYRGMLHTTNEHFIDHAMERFIEWSSQALAVTATNMTATMWAMESYLENKKKRTGGCYKNKNAL